MKHKHHIGCRAGFTLIELLVVIAVMTILAATLLAVLGQAKATARATVCLNRVRNWNLAVPSYAEDHEGILPQESATAPVTERDSWSEVRNASFAWYNSLAAMVGTAAASNYAPAALRAEFHSRSLPFQCPQASFNGFAPNFFAIFSIAMNSQLCEPPYPTISWTAIERSRTCDLVLFTEGRLDGEPAADSVFADPSELGQPAVCITRFAARHRNRGNLGMADGSVHRLTFKQIATQGILWEAR